MKKLSQRLLHLAEMVPSGGRLADIGTDHAYIPIFLVMEGRIPSAVAMDIGEGPLSRARINVAAHCLEAKIELRLSDGLKELHADEADTVLIAGMGGGLMVRILEAGGHAIRPGLNLVLQPQSEIQEFRKYLRMHDFQILKEDMVFEDGKYYPMIFAKKEAAKGSGDGMPAMHAEGGRQETEDLCGPCLLAARNPVLLEWLKKEIKVQETILNTLGQKKENESMMLRKNQIREKLVQLKQAESLFA